MIMIMITKTKFYAVQMLAQQQFNSIQFTFAGFTLQAQLKTSTNTQIHRYNRVTQTKQKNTKTDKVNQE